MWHTIRLHPACNGGMDVVAKPASTPRRTEAPRSPSRQGPLGRLHPLRTAWTPRGRQRLVPVRPAVRDAKLVQRLVIRGRRRELGLGAATLVPLAKARELALANRMLARSGGDPLSEKRRVQGVPTFAEAARRVLEQKRGGWRGRWHVHNWWRSMERYVFPRVGSRPVSEVNTADVLEILTPIWHVKAATAREVRQRIRSMLEWAIALDMRADNPCDRVVPVLGPQNDIVTHRLALPHKDVAAAIETVRMSKSGQPAASSWRRVSRADGRSVGGGQARDVGRDGHGRARVDVPALRMKAKREHRVPLCGRALEVLDAARALGDGSRLLFPMRIRRAIAMSTMPKMLQYHEIAAVPHGFRSSFRDWAAEEIDHPREVIEAALAHVVQNKVEAAYARSDLFERRRRLMGDWAVYLGGGPTQAAAERL